jgi:organic radical activating enzyme
MEFKCIMLQHGLNVTALGSLTPCCVSSPDFIKIDGDSNIESLFRSEKWQKLYENYDNGIVNDICKYCFKRDTAAINSNLKTPRIKWNESHEKYYEAHLKEQQRGIKNKSIVRLFFSFGNICNQKCIMCNSRYSSKWLVDDAILLENYDDLERNDINRSELSLKSWRITDELIEQVLSLLDEHLESISILGGEPLFDKRLGYFLDRILEKNPNCRVSITTNLTPLTEEIIEILNKVKRLTLSVSMDGINDTYRWIRDYDFDLFSEKLDLLFKNNLLEHTVSINYTLMKYNVDKIKESFEFVDSLSKKYGKDLSFNIDGIVSKPLYLNLRYAEKEKILAGIDQLIALKEEQSLEPDRKKHRFSRGFPIDNMINYLKTNLENPPTDEERERERKFEEHLVRIRGWNING